MKPPALPALQPPPAPLNKVRFHHPHTGEETVGHVHKSGPLGITAQDEEGQTHKIPHGHYVVHHEEPKVDADRVVSQAKRHLDLGAGAPLAIYGAIALMAHGGAKRPHALRLEDVRVGANKVLLVPDKLRVVQPPQLVDLLTRWARDAERAGGGPLFRIRGKPVTEQEVTEYVKRFGLAQADPSQGGQPGQPGPGGQPMNKASAAAMEISAAPEPWQKWIEEGGYICELRRGRTGHLVTITIRHPSLLLPMHEVAPDSLRARHLAKEMVGDLRQGKMPQKHGVFAPDGR